MIKKKTVIEMVIVSVLGTLLHFLYDFCGQNGFIGVFSAVNESTWEHLKLLFWPMFFLTAVQYFFGDGEKRGFVFARLVGTLGGMFAITVIYYTVKGIIGRDISAVNIATFYIAVIITFAVSGTVMKNHTPRSSLCDAVSAAVFVIMGALFGIWTFLPPQLGIFANPIVL